MGMHDVFQSIRRVVNVLNLVVLGTLSLHHPPGKIDLCARLGTVQFGNAVNSSITGTEGFSFVTWLSVIVLGHVQLGDINTRLGSTLVRVLACFIPVLETAKI